MRNGHSSLSISGQSHCFRFYFPQVIEKPFLCAAIDKQLIDLRNISIVLVAYVYNGFGVYSNWIPMKPKDIVKYLFPFPEML